jgi:hypothetical protein
VIGSGAAGRTHRRVQAPQHVRSLLGVFPGVPLAPDSLDSFSAGPQRLAPAELQNNAGSARVTLGGTSPIRAAEIGVRRTVPFVPPQSLVTVVTI